MLTLTDLPDTLASEARPSTNFVKREDLFLRAGDDYRVLAYILTRGVPTGEDVVITSARLMLWPIDDFGSSKISLKRIIGSWTPGTLKWSNAPGVSSVAVEFSGALKKHEPITFDVTSQVQAFANGSTPNRGLRLETDSTSERVFHSADADGEFAQYRPVLEVEFSTAPDTPSGIVVTGGKQVSVARPLLTWLYADDGGSPIDAYQVQANATDSWGDPSYDSGEVAATEGPQHRWHEDIADGASTWWRVRHRNADGRWSGWSSGHQFGRTVKPVLTVTAPSGVVPDYTPAATWSLDSGTQTQFRVRYSPKEANFLLADSLWVAGADRDWAPADPLPVSPGDRLVHWVMVTDEVDRVATPGDPVEIVAERGEFEVGPDDSTAPVTGLTVEAESRGRPVLVLRWSRSATPDEWVIERRAAGGPWRAWYVRPGDTAQGGGAHLWRDVTAPPWRALEYRVRASEGAQMSDAPDVVEVQFEPRFIWLADPDDADWVLTLADREEGTWALGEDSAVFAPRGAGRSILVHEGFRGYEGSVSGRIVGDVPVEGMSSISQRDAAWRLKREPTKIWRLIVGDMNLPVVVRNVNVIAQPSFHEPVFGVSLEFFQQGELGWDSMPVGA